MQPYRVQLLAIAYFLLSALAAPAQAQPEDARLYRQAQKLARKTIITDGHVDLPFRLKVINFRLDREYIGIPIQSEQGEFDYVRAKQGGLDAPFMSIFIPASYQDGRAKLLADSLISMVEGIIRAHPKHFAHGRSPAEVEANFRKGLVSLPMGMENGAPIEGDLANIEYFFQRGIRYITLTHGKDNEICDSSYDTTRTWNGLSPFGREVVREMNRLGMMIDISHVSDSTFWQVMELSAAPCIASHSSCRAFTPGFERNMSDEMIVRLGQNGGVIQINFGTDFLDSELSAHNRAKRAELQNLLAARDLSRDSPEAAPLIAQFRRDNPTLYADVQLVADHIDHAVRLAGIDHVGLGSDFDGVGDSLPTGLKDVSQYPNLIYELLRRGYSKEDIAKICYKNVWRVWNEVLRQREG
jgi:membrane dipeptidase